MAEKVRADGKLAPIYATYQIVLVGLNKEQINNLPKNIIGIEHTDSVSELVELYTSATVFVNPTLEDNYPILLPVG